MTNLEAIQAKINHPLPDNSYLLVLSDNGLVSTAQYDPDTDKKALDLSQADAIYILCTQAHTTEGGYSIKITDRYALLKVADTIYRRYGISIPTGRTAKFVSKW